MTIVFFFQIALESILSLYFASYHSLHLDFPSFNTMHCLSSQSALYSLSASYQLSTQKPHFGKIPIASLLPKPMNIFLIMFSDLSMAYANPESHQLPTPDL